MLTYPLQVSRIYTWNGTAPPVLSTAEGKAGYCFLFMRFWSSLKPHKVIFKPNQISEYKFARFLYGFQNSCLLKCKHWNNSVIFGQWITCIYWTFGHELPRFFGRRWLSVLLPRVYVNFGSATAMHTQICLSVERSAFLSWTPNARSSEPRELIYWAANGSTLLPSLHHSASGKACEILVKTLFLGTHTVMYRFCYCWLLHCSNNVV